MKDYLRDIVGHTHDLGCVDLVKIVGTTEKTDIVAQMNSQLGMIIGHFHNPVPEFVGTFGMPNLAKLKILLNLEEYKENSQLSIIYDKNVLDGIDFTNAGGDFKNSYRFMASNIISAKVQTPKMVNSTWHIVDMEPTVPAIQRMRYQAQAHSEDQHFQVQSNNNDLIFKFGDPSSHSGWYTFQSNTNGKLKRSWLYPTTLFINVLSMNGDKRISFSDDGVARIVVDSGLANYEFYIVGHTK